MQQNVLFAAAALVLLLVSTEGLPTEAIDRMKAAAMTCKTRLNTPDDIVKTVMETGKLNDETSETGTCYIQCIMEGMGLVDKNGVFNADEKKELVEKGFKDYKKPDGLPVNVDKIKKDIDDCVAAAKGDTQCAKNYQIWTCMNDKREEAGIHLR